MGKNTLKKTSGWAPVYKIEKSKDGYVLFKAGDFNKHHTHLISLRMAKQIKYNVIHSIMPKTRNIRLLYSHIRIAEDKAYIDKIQKLIDVRKSKGKQVYYNRSS